MKIHRVIALMIVAFGFSFSSPIRDTVIVESTTTEKEAFQKWALLPVLISSEETSWRFGGFAAYFIEQKDSTINSSSIETAGYFTLKNQSNFSIKPNLYWDFFHLEAYLFYERWPANYYGVGMKGVEDSTSFDAKNIGLELLLEKKVFPKLYVGINIEITQEDITPDEKESILTQLETEGGSGARTSGVGAAVTYDNKNHQYWATQGEEVSFESYVFHKAFGSEYDFVQYRFKAKKYFPIGKGAIASIVNNEVVYGDHIPFRNLVTPDGTYEVRGLEKGRYRDNNLITAGLEYRREIWWRLGLVFFTEAFQLWGQTSDFSVGRTLYSVGGGVRFALNQQQKFNVRADYSYIQESGLGLTVYVREAF